MNHKLHERRLKEPANLKLLCLGHMDSYTVSPSSTSGQEKPLLERLLVTAHHRDSSEAAGAGWCQEQDVCPDGPRVWCAMAAPAHLEPSTDTVTWKARGDLSWLF